MEDIGIDFDPIPILELEQEAMYAFLRQLNLTDVLVFSFLSPQCAEHVKMARINIAPLVVKVRSNEVRIVFRRRVFRHRWADLVILNQQRPNPERDPLPLIFLGHEWINCAHIEKTERAVTIFPLYTMPIITVFLAVRHARRLIQETVNAIEFTTTDYVGGVLLWNCFPPIVHAIIDGTNNQAIVDSFLQRTTILDTFSIYGSECSLLEHFDRFCNSRDITIQVPAPWFLLEHLRSVNCEVLTVYNANITNADLRQFINDWREDRTRPFSEIVLTPHRARYDPDQIYDAQWFEQDVAPQYRYFARLYKATIKRPTDNARLLIGLGLYQIAIKFRYNDD